MAPWSDPCTYVRTFAGWVYCAFVLDVFSVGSWAGRSLPRCAQTWPWTH
jgi:hypothetical protein